jgi:CHAT domain-containing protein
MSEDLVMIPTSPGELIDKITILEIKKLRLRDPDQLKNVDLEYQLLGDIRSKALPAVRELDHLTSELRTVNEQLWDVEEELRICEERQQFDEKFVSLARNVYCLNDQRALLKRTINSMLDSRITEEKSYALL